MSERPSDPRAAVRGSAEGPAAGARQVPEAVERLLRERSRQLASRRLERVERRILEEVVVARRDDSLIGIPIGALEEVRPVIVTRLPMAPVTVCGLFQVRGSIFCLVDLQPFFGEAVPVEHGARVLAALLAGAAGKLGLRIDEVIGPRQIAFDDVDPRFEKAGVELVRYVTRDLVQVLSIDALRTAPALRMKGSL